MHRSVAWVNLDGRKLGIGLLHLVVEDLLPFLVWGQVGLRNDVALAVGEYQRDADVIADDFQIKSGVLVGRDVDDAAVSVGQKVDAQLLLLVHFVEEIFR